MLAHVVGDRAVGTKGRCQNQPDLALRHQKRNTVPYACLGTAITDHLEAEGRLVIVRSLLGVADVELDVVSPVDRKDVVGLVLPWKRRGSHGRKFTCISLA